MALTWSFTASVASTVSGTAVRAGLSSYSRSQLLSLAFPIVYAIPIFNVFGNLAHDWMWWYVTRRFAEGGADPSSQVHPVVLVHWAGNHNGTPHNREYESRTRNKLTLAVPPMLTDSVQGMLFGWAVLSPLAKHNGWAPGPVSSTVDGARGWILWPALAIMMAESILSISMVAISTLFPPPTVEDTTDSVDAAGASDVAGGSTKGEDEADMRLVLGGVVLSCVSCVLLVARIFGEAGIQWWATVIALLLASLFSILGCAHSLSAPPWTSLTRLCTARVRALGETDLNPCESCPVARAPLTASPTAASLPSERLASSYLLSCSPETSLRTWWREVSPRPARNRLGI